MEYVLVSAITMTIMFVFFKNINKLDTDMPKPTHLRQSNAFVKINKEKEKVLKPRQSLDFLNKRLKKIMFIEDNAYNNTVEKVDTMTMNKVELDKMIFIIEKLTERN